MLTFKTQPMALIGPRVLTRNVKKRNSLVETFSAFYYRE